MAKTLENLTNEELDIIQEYVELFGISEAEALVQAISEGSITEGGGGSFQYKPEGFEELKYYVVNNKSALYKINKQLKKEKKDEMFPEDNFLYGTKITKLEDGSYDLDNCSTTVVGESAKIIVNKVMYKASRSAFDGTGKPESTNFDTTLAASLYPSDQEQMFTFGGVKGTTAKTVIDALKKEYHDGKQGKTQEKVPEKLKVKFKVVLFGLVEIDGEWKKFFMELTNKYSEEESLTALFEKDAKGIKTQWINNLEITGTDSFENPIIQIVPQEKMEMDSFKKINSFIRETSADIDAFIEAQKSSAAPTATGSKSKPEVEDDNGTDEDPFED